MFSLLLSILLGAIIVGLIMVLLMIVLGLGVVAAFGLKILLAIGLIYLGIKCLRSIFN